jgi:GWxTD domain-containing protein
MKIKTVNILAFLLFFDIATCFAQESVNTYHNKGLMYLSEGKITEAEKSFYQSASEYSYALSYFELAKIESDKNTIYGRRKAREYIQKAIWKEPTNIEFRLLKAKLMEVFSRGMAYDVYEDILDIDPDNSEALFNLGRISEEEFYEYHNSYMKEGFDPALSFDEFAFEDFNKAENFFKKAIKIDPRRTDTYLHLSSLYTEAGEFENGLPLLNKIIAIDSLNKNAYLFLGYLYYKTFRFDSCQLAYKKALDLMTEEEKEEFKINSTMMLFGDKETDQKKIDQIVNDFWNSKDPLYLTDYNERLLEHYSRVAYSNIRFSVAKQNITGWKSDRGEIMVRYGDPINHIRLRPYINAGGKTQLMLKTDVWVYNDKVFGFTDDYWTGNFRYSSPSIYGRHFSQYFYDTDTYVKYLRKSEPEEYIPKFRGPMFNVPFETTQFKDLDNEKNENTQLYLNYALDISDKFEFRNKYKLQHQSGLFLLDSNKNKLGEQVEEYTYLGNERELKLNTAEKYWINSLEIEAKLDSGNLAFEVVREKDGGVSTNHFGFKVKNFDNKNLDMSDIVLAINIEKQPGSKYSLIRKSLAILPNPTRTFTVKTDIYLYYEVYNLKQDENHKTSFEQTITLKKVDENSFIENVFSSLVNLFGSKHEDEVILTTNYQSLEKNTQVYLQLDMSSYQPGDYIINVTVNDKLGGRETSAESLIKWR